MRRTMRLWVWVWGVALASFALAGPLTRVQALFDLNLARAQLERATGGPVE